MDTNYRFSNLIGTVYRNGQILFSSDGYSVLSPVGNKISIIDLKNNQTRTIAIDCEYSILSMSLNPAGTHLILITEAGDILFVNLETETVIHRFRATKLARHASFSPCGRYLALSPENDLQIQEMGSMVNNIFRPFHLIKTFHLSPETLTCINWSFDSRLICFGSEDKQIRIVPVREIKNFTCASVSSHKGRIVCADFMRDSYDMISIDQRGLCNFWKSNLQATDLVVDHNEESEEKVSSLFLEKTNKASLHELAGIDRIVDVTAAAFHRDSCLLVVGFDNGVFVLLEVPTLSLIHNLRISDVQITSIAPSRTGDWLAIGCGKGFAAQLVVWEWQSETYVMKQQSHSERILSAMFSPDGSSIATGAEDGKLKIWSCRSSFCVVTFNEHTSGVSAVAWTQSGKAILSSSLDGTVRAHDLKRYRNFRTLVCPEPTQLGALCVDTAGEIVVAAAKELFNVFVWSLETGRLLDVLSGHSSVVSSISISNNSLLTGSWDKTFKLWNITESQPVDHADLTCECLCVAFSPCGTLIAVLTMDSNIAFYTTDLQQIGSIDARLDFDAGRSKQDKVTKERSQKNKSMTTMCFSPDGSLLLVGGESVFLCLYSVLDRILLKKFAITRNRSLDGVVLDVNRRQFTEFGNMALCDASDSDDDHKEIKLPGTRHSDKGERAAFPEISVYHVSFCPTGRRFSVSSTEGVAIYSLDKLSLFDPFQLDSSTNPESVKRYLAMSDYATALMAALRLNDSHLVAKCCEFTPLAQVELVCQSLTLLYAERLLKWISEGEVVWNSPHIHFYMKWVNSILNVHGAHLKSRADVALLTGIQQIVHHHEELMQKMADQNKYGLQYLIRSRRITKKSFLGSFEELLPDAAPEQTLDENKDNVKKSKKRKAVEEKSEDQITADEIKLKKPKKAEKKAKKSAVDSGSEETVSETRKLKVTKKIINDVDSLPKSKKMRKKSFSDKQKSKEVSENSDEDNEEIAVDDNTPVDDIVDLSAWLEFSLPEEIMRGLKSLKFSSPTEIQRLVLPSAIRDRLDVLGAAETGSGKTLAYAIPAIARLLENSEGSESRGPKVLIMVPTRELAVQVRRHIDALLKFTAFKAVSIVGGLSQQKQERLLNAKPEIIVATPGRLWALMDGPSASDFLSDMSSLQMLVIDETDRMVERGHFEELELILAHIHRFTAEKLQTLVFSATLTYVHPAPKWMTESKAKQLTPEEKLKRLTGITGLRNKRKIYDITREFGTAEKLVETRMNCEDLLEKDITIAYLLHRYRGRTLVFLNSVDAARRLYGILTKLNFTPSPMLLHARMQQRQRLKNLERFAASKNAILLATDVAARGLDIRGIEHVIHYQVPKTAELYIHRSGRTARASASGLTVLLVDSQDVSFYRRICQNLNRKQDLPLFPIDAPQLFSALKPRIKIASELDTKNWFTKTAKEADLVLDEWTKEDAGDNELDGLLRDSKAKQFQLRSTLSQSLPSFEKGELPKTRYITPDIRNKYDETISAEALDSFNQTVGETKTKKKLRKLLSSRDLGIGKKFKKHKKRR
ncbi:unnamed protein product, partial [Mesorhabditis belari]|uniref:RNA helicase n=1 Tax=Mesorhabditis belari TaxID=2138241 RepID=A0AAF3EB84_9BILA